MDTNTADKAYRVLARKYRPENFSDLIGQEPMVRTLTNAFEAGRIAQAWMLTGVRGVGKTTTARILARALNYKTETIDRPTINFTEPGEHCQAIMEGRHVDVVEMDAASHTGIDDIREIIEQVRYRPVSARYKVYIIDEVHMLSTQAFNGLLKTLEEPPPHVKFIFATTEIRKVPITVLSRCQRFDLRRIDSATLTEHLRKISDAEKIETDDSALAMIARAGEGSVRDALSILDQAIAHGDGHVHVEAVRSMLGLADRARIIDLFELVMQGNIAGALRELKNQYDAGADPVVIITELADFNHLVTRLRFTPELQQDVSLSEEERMRGADFASKLAIRTLSQSWQMLLKGVSEVDNAPRPLQAAEMLLIRLAHMVDLPTLDEALKAMIEGRMPNIVTPTLQSGEDVAAPVLSVVASATEQPAIVQASVPVPADNIGQSIEQPVEAKTLTPEAEAKTEPVAKPIAASPVDDMPPATQLSESVQALNPAQENYARQTRDTADVPEQKKKVRVENVADMIALADEHRDLQFKFYLKEYVRPISVAPGQFEFVPTQDAPRNLSSIISKMLQEWTGERWAVTLVDEGGGMTIAEEEKAKREALLSDAEADPDVNAILQQFPGARIVDVRLNLPDEPVADDEEGTEPLQEVSENDDD